MTFPELFFVNEKLTTEVIYSWKQFAWLLRIALLNCLASGKNCFSVLFVQTDERLLTMT